MRPVLEYGSSTFGTAASTTLQKLDKIQNTGLRIISGGMKSTPINEMESLAGLKSLQEQREEKIVLQAEKYKRLQRHPMHKKMSELNSYRIKRSSFKKTARAMCAKDSDIMPQGEDVVFQNPINPDIFFEWVDVYRMCDNENDTKHMEALLDYFKQGRYIRSLYAWNTTNRLDGTPAYYKRK